MKGLITSCFAFPDLGTCEVKLKTWTNGMAGFFNVIVITIERSTGQDLKLWTAFKKNPDLACVVPHAPGFDRAESIKSRLESYETAETRRRQKG